ncbi:MAG: CTP synthase [Candidatus Aenigmatarchaeota archaeon]
MPKYVFVLGGGYSGLGKGIVTASVARILSSYGLKVRPIKIDPYFNFGAGDMNPNEHGEVFVTEDGGEVDQDFGHYERFTGIPCSRIQNITSGKVFNSVIEKGRMGHFLGKSIQVIPHVRDEHKAFIREAANGCDIAIVEVGGTIGDDEALIVSRAIQSMIYSDKETASVAVLVPIVMNEEVGEPKTKIAQTAIRALNELGLWADFMFVRTQNEMMLDNKRKEKLAVHCAVEQENIICDPSTANVYEIPKLFERQQLGAKLLKKLGVKPNGSDWTAYDSFLSKIDAATERIPIAYVGKYVSEGKGIHKDAYISVEEALRRACIEFGFVPELHRIDAVSCEKDIFLLKKVAGIIVPGGYGSRGIEGKINAIRYAREAGVPFLGLCLGLQLGVVEFSRNVLGIADAHSDEFDETAACPSANSHVICILPEQERMRASQGYIGTQRLGDFACVLERGHFVQKLYERVGRPDAYEQEKLKKYDMLRLGRLKPDDFVVFERHRHRREVNPAFHEKLLEAGMQFPGIHRSMDGTTLVEVISLKDHPYFVATQAHPEFTSNYLRPNPLFLGFAEAVRQLAQI